MGGSRYLADEHPVRPIGVGQEFIVRVLRVAPEEAGSRLDVFLSRALRSTSRTRAKTIAEASAYSSDGRRRKPSERLHSEERVVLWRKPIDDVDPDLALSVVYEDRHLLVVNKPPHLTVHPTARHYRATVTHVLSQARPNERLRLIHRLDKETSGVLLVARSTAADRAFKKLFEGPRAVAPRRHAAFAPVEAPRRVDKTYLAICWGHAQAERINLPVEPDVDNPLRVKMRIARSNPGLAARTDVTLLATCPGYSLVRCRLLTGRQHQIRVHLAARGTPVVGDKLYGPDDRMLARAADQQLSEADLARLELPRHALHAASYELPHALTGEPLVLQAPLATDLVKFWSAKSGGDPDLLQP